MTRIAAKATRGRGKKCPKGQSCVSNPVTKKHRNKVSKLVATYGECSNKPTSSLSSIGIKPKLTKDVLEKFDAIQSQKQRNQDNNVGGWLQENFSGSSNNETASENEGINEDAFSIGNISAASIWSNCTNVSFDKFLNGFDPKSKIHKEMLAILATIRDAIDHEKGSETETEYFSGLMLMLNCVDSEEKLTATLALLQMVLKRIHTSVLRLKFSETSSALLRILSQQINSPNPNGYLTKSVINALHTLLLNQEPAIWQVKSTQQIFDTILLFVLHPKPRIRKSANLAVVLSVCNFSKDFDENKKTSVGSNVPAKLTAEFCILKLEEHLTTTNAEHLNLILYIFNLLSQTMPFFPSLIYTQRVSEAILSHMTLGNVLLVTGALHTFYTFFLKRPSLNVLNAELNARLLNALYDYQPNINDDQPLNAWCAAIKESLLSLNNLDRKIFFMHVPKFLKTSINCLQSDSSQVHSNISNSIKSIMKIIIDDGESLTIPDDLLMKIYSELETSLKYQYSHAWTQIIPIFSDCLLKNKKIDEKYGSIMQRLAIIHESNNADVNRAIEQVFANLIRSRGPRFVLNYCPILWKTYGTDKNNSLEYDSKEFRGEFTNAWLLPIMAEHICDHSELSLFVDHFLPIADGLMKKESSCRKLAAEVNNSQMQIDGSSSDKVHHSCLLMVKELNRCIHSLWTLLPAFCRNPIDIQEVFPKIARRIGETLYNKEFAVYSLAALRNLLKCDETVQKVVGRFSKNFLPILFNIYTNENENSRIHDGLRFPVLVLIQLFVPLIFTEDNSESLEIFKTFYDKLMFRLNEEHCSYFRRQALLDIIGAFLFSPKGLNEIEIEKIYSQTAKPLIENSEFPTEQKKGLRMIEEIIMSNTLPCQQFLNRNVKEVVEYLFSLLNDSKPIKSPSTKAFVLRTTRRIIVKFFLTCNSNEQTIDWSKFFEESLVPVMKNLIVKSTKTKRRACELLLTIAECFEKFETNRKTSPKIVSMIIDPLKNNQNLDISERTYRMDAIAFLYVVKFHHPSVSKDVVSDIADAIFFYLSNLDILPPNRAMLKICFEFIRHFFNNAPNDLLNSYLEVITCGITNLPQDHRTKFHSSIKIFLTKLCRKFGFELIHSMIPEDYQKVLKNIRKIEIRKKKKKENASVTDGDQSDQKSTRSRKSSKSKFYDYSDDEEDDVQRFVNEEFDNEIDIDDDEKSTRKSFKSKPVDLLSRLSNISIKNYIREEIEGDPIDLLSAEANKNIFSRVPKKYLQPNGETSSGGKEASTLPISEDGRINIGKLFDQLEGAKKGQKRPRNDEDSEIDDDEESDLNEGFETKSYKPGGKGIHRPVSVYGDTKSKVSSKHSVRSKKSQKSNKSSKSIMTGKVFQSKKAAGDMKRKGMPDPYAYYPFTAVALNKRKVIKNRGQFKSIIQGARKGAAKGKRLRKKRMKSN